MSSPTPNERAPDTRTEALSQEKQNETVIVSTKAENGPGDEYSPARWQSNVTIVSCVCWASLRKAISSGLISAIVSRKFQRWFPEHFVQPHECHLYQVVWKCRVHFRHEDKNE